MGNFCLGKNDKVNASDPTVPSTQKVTKISHKDTGVIAQPTTAHGLSLKKTITHEEQRVALILSLTVGFATWHMFR